MRRRFVTLMLVVLLVLSLFPSISVFAEEKTKLVLKVELTENSRILTWNEYPGADSYYACMRLTYNVEGEKSYFMPIHDFPLTKTSIEDFGKITGRKKFTYKVKALDAEGKVIAESNIVTVYIKNPDCQYKYTFEIGKNSYIKNGVEILFKQGKIILENHRIYMPIKLLFDEMEYELTFDSKEKKSTFNQNNKKFEFWHSGEDFFTYNGDTYKFAENDSSVTVKLIGGVLYMPMFPVVRFMDAYDVKLDPIKMTIDMTFDCPEEYSPLDEMVTRKVSLTLDKDIIIVDGQDYKVGCGLRLFGDSTYLPVEFLLKGFGLKAVWEDENNLHFFKWNYKNPKKKSAKFVTVVVGDDKIDVGGESRKLRAPSKMEDGILYVTLDFMQIFEVQTVWDSASKTISFEMDVPADAINGLQNTETVKRSAKFFLKGTQQGDDEIMMLDGLEYVGKPLVISGGSTMLPIKYFAQAFGGDYAWKPEKDEMVIEMKKSAGNGEFVDIRAVFHTGEKEYEIDGEVFEMFAPAEIIEGEFYIPARPVLDHFEVEGTWNADEKSMAFESEVELGRKIKLERNH